LAVGLFCVYFQYSWMGEILGQEKPAISDQGLDISLGADFFAERIFRNLQSLLCPTPPGLPP
jgi:hypothetical protein